MKKNKFSGLSNLHSKSMSIIAFALSSLLNSDVSAQELPQNGDDKNKSINFTDNQEKKLKPQLILKLNSSDHMNSKILAFHRSHSSHSSHRSHSSHSSHYSSSSYSPSSRSTYTPAPTPVYTPPPTYTSPTRSTKSVPKTSGNSSNTLYSDPTSKSSSNVATSYALGDRVLYKGCEGADVKALQQLLLQLNYDVVVSEYFGDKTELAVIQFQKRHELKPTGRVDSTVLSKIKSSL